MTDSKSWSPLAINVSAERNRKNYPRSKGQAITHVVIHCTGSSFESAHHRFMGWGGEGVSPHYLIKKDGTIIQYVDDQLNAGHAGICAFSKRVYGDKTWRKWKRKLSGMDPHYANEGPTQTQVEGGYTFIKLTSGKDWKIYEPLEANFRKRLGPAKGVLPYNFATSENTNDYSIGIEIEHVSYAYEEAQYEALIQLLEDLCSRHQIPYDRYHIVGHEDTNPIERWGWDPGTVPRADFDWGRVLEGGDWKLEEGEPPLVAPRTFSLVRFPFGEARRSPLSVYYENEASYGGFFPFGLRGNLHSGVHLYPPGAAEGSTEPAPVRCMAPGWVVAARLGAGTPESLELTGNHLGFVLVRHEFQERDEAGSSTGAPHALYSLYFHLCPPDWDALEDGPYGRVPWLQELVRTRHGSIVIVAAEGQTPGTQYWAAQPLPAELRGALKVYGDDGTVVDLTLEGPEGAVLAVSRAQPVDSAQALEALQEGCVTTFAAPFLTTGRGDVVGLVAPLEGHTAFPSGFLHWELFAPANAGVSKLLDLAKATFGLGDEFFPVVEDEGNDNVWSRDELNQTLTGKLPAGDQGALDGELFASAEYEQGILKLLHGREPLSFADHSADDATWSGRAAPAAQAEDLELLTEYPECRTTLTYPYVLTIENRGGLLSPGKHAVKLRVTFEPEGLGEGAVEITEAGDEWTVTIQVPAAATKILLHPEGDLVLDTQPIPVDQTKALQAQALKTLVPYRWRNVCVRHVSPWSLQALEAHVKSHEDLPTSAYAPVAWWDLGQDPGENPAWREVPVLGASEDETSIFGSLLPGADGQVDTIHPVTGAWLLNALAEQRQIKLLAASDWTRFSGSGESAEEADQPMHWGWVSTGKPLDQLALGDLVHALVVAKGYCTGADGGQAHAVALSVEGPEQRSLSLGAFPYQRGVASTSLEVPFWGTWSLQVEGEGGAIPKTLVVKRPVLAESNPEPTRRSGVVTWPLSFSDGRPTRLAGWVGLRHWRVRGAEAPSGPGTLAGFAIPAEALAVADPGTVNEDLTLDASGEFVTGSDDAEASVPDASSSFSYSEYADAAEAGGAFKLAISLARMVQAIRKEFGLALQALSPKTDPYLTPQKLTADGLSIELRQSNTKKNTKKERDFEHLKAVALSVCPAAVADTEAKTVRIAVAAPSSNSGPSTVEFVPRDALARLYRENEPQADESLRVAFGFVALNGGRAAGQEDGDLIPSSDGSRDDPEAQAGELVELDLAAIRERTAPEDLVEAWASPSVTLSSLAFEAIEVLLLADGLQLTAPFSAAASHKEFVAAKPGFVREGSEPFGKAVKGKTQLTGSLTFADLIASPSETVAVEARLLAETTTFAGQEVTVPGLALELAARPRFSDLRAELEQLEGLETVSVSCRVLCCGTSKDFGLRVYKGGAPIEELATKAIFDQPQQNADKTETSYFGHMTVGGVLRATFARADLDAHFRPGDVAHFEFYRPHGDGKVYGVAIEPAAVRLAIPGGPSLERIERIPIELAPLEISLPTWQPGGLK